MQCVILSLHANSQVILTVSTVKYVHNEVRLHYPETISTHTVEILFFNFVEI